MIMIHEPCRRVLFKFDRVVTSKQERLLPFAEPRRLAFGRKTVKLISSSADKSEASKTRKARILRRARTPPYATEAKT